MIFKHKDHPNGRGEDKRRGEKYVVVQVVQFAGPPWQPGDEDQRGQHCRRCAQRVARRDDSPRFGACRCQETYQCVTQTQRRKRRKKDHRRGKCCPGSHCFGGQQPCREHPEDHAENRSQTGAGNECIGVAAHWLSKVLGHACGDVSRRHFSSFVVMRIRSISNVAGNLVVSLGGPG